MEGRRAFPFRDFLVARTYEPRADATAMLIADALAQAVGDVEVLRVEGEALDRAARYAALVVAGTPVRRRPPGVAGGDPSQLAARLGVPVVVASQGRATIDLSSSRSIVCGVRNVEDAACVTAAGALADALDLQLILAHVGSQPGVAALGAPAVPVAPGPGSNPDRAAARELVGEIARLAGRTAPGASCPRLAEGAPGEELCRIATDERARLIAVTASGASRLWSTVRGSVARDLLRRADRPVFVWPREPSPALASDLIPSGQRSRAG